MSSAKKIMVALAVATGALVFVLFPASAIAAPEYTIDPTLSLDGIAGAEGTNSFDPVPDPGENHPPKPLENPCGVTTDEYGDIYVASSGATSVGGEPGENGRIDVFNADGEFLTEVKNEYWPCSVAVDSEGHLYVYGFWQKNAVRYDPTVYNPAAGEIAYGPAGELIGENGEYNSLASLGIDPANDHVFMSRFDTANGGLGYNVEDWTAEEEQGFPGTNHYGVKEVEGVQNVAVWGNTGDIYTSGYPGSQIGEGRAYVVDGTSRLVKQTLDGSATPDGSFDFTTGRAGIAVDQSNGDFYIADVEGHHVVDQFEAPEAVLPGEEAPEKYLGQIKLESGGLKASNPWNGVAVDRGEHSPNQGYIYVTSGERRNNSHLYAFAPVVSEPPEIKNERAEVLGESEAVLDAELNPHGFATSYQFEYGVADCATSACESLPVPAADAGSGGAFKAVSLPVSGLTPGTKYHFRIVATSNCNPVAPAEECTVDGPDATFTTYPSSPVQTCPNVLYRFGPSATLPDCRAYELVTPSDTNGRIPGATIFGEGAGSPPIPLVSPDGENLLFGTEGGALPGLDGGGFHDAFVSIRDAGGWQTEFAGLDGVQAQTPFAAGDSGDHRYSFWDVRGTKGSLADQETGSERSYLRGPGGTIEPIGVGSQESDPSARGLWLSPTADHVIFSSYRALEPDSPPPGTLGIYDRGPEGPTHVVSLRPNGEPFGGGVNSRYAGVAPDGSAIAFEVEGTLYLRLAGEETIAIAGEQPTFGGVGIGGRVFYLRTNSTEPFLSGTSAPKIPQGQLFVCDASAAPCTGPGAQAPVQIGSGEKSVLVNVSDDGSRAYFISPAVLTSQPNSEGAKAVSGQENLFVWDASSEAVRFLGTVDEEDVIGEAPPPGGSGDTIGGLGMWITDALNQSPGQFDGPANDPSRTSADGGTFVFESRAQLTSYENEGRSEIYRYDYGSDEMSCISCDPSGTPPSSDARLEARYAPRLEAIPPVNALSLIGNVAAGGSKIFFQSGDRLVPGDLDGKVDVYEWEAQGKGGCERPTGCLGLISYGHSTGDDFLYGVGESGRDVFIWSTDLLSAQDRDGAPSIYDAREGGGFPARPSPPGECLGEACQPAAVAPNDSTPGSSSFVGPGNVKPVVKQCPKGKHRVRTSGGKTRCVRRHRQAHHKKNHRRAHR